MTHASTARIESLTPSEVAAVCRAVGAPLPTPDVPLRSCLEMVGVAADHLPEALDGATEPMAIVARDRLRGSCSVVRLPPDPRLRPAPLPPRPTPASAARAEAGATGERRIASVGECPCTPGSSRARRWALISVGATLDEARAAGVKRSDLERWVGSGAIVLEPADG